MLDWLLITPAQALEVAVATAAIYWVFVVLVRVLGQGPLARVSSSDLASAVALGAVLGRAALGRTPNFGGGVVALLTLFAMQALAGQLQRAARSRRLLDSPPLLLMAGTEVLHENLRRSHLVEDELWPRLRLAGIGSPSEVACVILEPTGEISVLRRGTRLDREMMRGVRGAEHLEALFDVGDRGP
ncbi:DUF421 domain-containing protein [Sinomonas sp.]|uniref:DUF421 domain-containing protein n=1 Tax=Sinomonas sp. TaxID=1914986 RepID=UPI002FE04DD5